MSFQVKSCHSTSEKSNKLCFSEWPDAAEMGTSDLAEAPTQVFQDNTSQP